MRVIVVMAGETPVDVLQIPADAASWEVEKATAALDRAGVTYEILPVSMNAEAADLLADVERFEES